MNHNSEPEYLATAAAVPQTSLPNDAVILTATVKALPGQEAVVRRALIDLIGPSRSEPGCLCYNLHESVDEAGLFIFYEQWTNQAALDVHFETPHFLALDAKIEGRTEPPVLAFQTMLG